MYAMHSCKRHLCAPSVLLMSNQALPQYCSHINPGAFPVLPPCHPICSLGVAPICSRYCHDTVPILARDLPWQCFSFAPGAPSDVPVTGKCHLVKCWSTELLLLLELEWIVVESSYYPVDISACILVHCYT